MLTVIDPSLRHIFDWLAGSPSVQKIKLSMAVVLRSLFLCGSQLTCNFDVSGQ